MLIRFVKPYGIWNSGEVAGFDEEDTRKIIALGVAVLYDSEPKTEAVESPAVDKMMRRRKTK